MKRSKLLTILLAASVVVLAQPAPAQDGGHLILRAPQSEVAGIAARHGLEILDRVETPPDAEGHSVFLVRAPAVASPAEIAGDIEELEPAAAGVEPLALASLPETGPDVDLGQRGMSILTAIERAQRFSPPSGSFDPDRGTLEDRQIPAGEPQTLTLAMERVVGTRQGDYALAVDFAEGCHLELTSDGLEIGGDPRFHKNRAIWRVTNLSRQTLMIDAITLGWPVANEDLEKVRLGRYLIFDHSRAPASAVIDSEWKDPGHPEYQQLAPGETEDLIFEFKENVARQSAGYTLALSFAVAADERDCRVSAGNRLKLEGDLVEWSITNHHDEPITVVRVSAAWPPENGSVRAIELGGREIVEPVFSALGSKADGSPRYVWSAFVEQPAAALLRLAEVRAKYLGSGIVAIIDSGVDPDHPLFAHRLLPGYDFLRDQPGSASEWVDVDQRGMAILTLNQRGMAILTGDDVLALNPSTAAILGASQLAELDPGSLPPAFGHGTMAAGIVHLAAPDAAILPLKAFDGHGRGNVFDIVEAIYYAVDHGAHVINMSFSAESFSPELMRAVNYAARRGVTCVAAAGNDGDEVMVYPAALGNSIGVASTTDDDNLSAFSNHGSDLVTIAAPGEDLVTSYPGGGWALASGTSFAAPWISGAVALLADKNGKSGEPGRADFFLTSEALSHAEPVRGELGGRAGHGRADLKQAIDNVDGGVSPDPTPPATYSIAVEFTEGCTAHYPPAASGAGCSVGVANQISFHHNRTEWELTNVGDGTITIRSITLAWPEENGELEKIKLGGNEIFRGNRAPASTTIDSGWRGKSSKRQIPSGETRSLSLEFENFASES